MTYWFSNDAISFERTPLTLPLFLAMASKEDPTKDVLTINFVCSVDGIVSRLAALAQRGGGIAGQPCFCIFAVWQASHELRKISDRKVEVSRVGSKVVKTK